MNLVRNKGFRIFLYILGYFSCAAVIALSVITVMRYTSFQTDIGNTNAYAETEAMRYHVYNTLSDLQTEMKSKLNWNASGLEKASLDFFDYSTGERETAAMADLAKSSGFPDVLTGLKAAGHFWENAQDYGNWYEPDSYYNENTLTAGSCFLKIRTDDLIRLIEDHALVYSIDSLTRYFELENTLASDPRTTISKEAEAEFSLYQQLVRNDYTDFLEDGMFFVLSDTGIFIYSPNFLNIRQYEGQRIIYEYYLKTPGSSLLYFSLPENITAKKSIDVKSDELANAIFAGTPYSSPIEAFYASLNEEQRSLIQNDQAFFSGSYIFANTAYSFGNDEITGLNIYDSRGISDPRNLQVSSDGYQNLAASLSDNADIYVCYDGKTGTLEQWYKDPSGKKQNYSYVKDIQSLTESSQNSFVFGMNLYESYSDALSFESLSFTLCKAIPSPALWLVISAVVFLFCVILLLIGVKAKLLAVDRVPFEILLIVYLIILFLIGWVLPHEAGRSVLRLVQNDLPATIAIFLLLILALYAMTAALFTSIARRIKCRCFVKELLTVKIVKLIIQGIRSLAKKTGRRFERLLQTYEKSLSGNKRLVIFASVLFAVNAFTLLIYGMLHDEAVLFSCLIVVAEAFAGYHLLKYSAGVEKVLAVSRQIENGDLYAKTDPAELKYNVKELGESLNHLGTGLSKAVDSSIRDERTKAELITNVSHDIKTPLTSIISYVDLLKKEPIESEKAREYIDILDKKSQRLKQLIMDLIEVSKTGTGNIELERTNLNLTELLEQVLGEYEDKMAECELEPVKKIDAENTVIYADGRRIFRIIDNIFNNVVKYAQSGTRVYIDLVQKEMGNKKQVALSVKNVSREMLNISAEELTERFVRGDRSRHTEGSGLGLSIARNLTELQDGHFDISIDGDLFKVEVSFPAVER